LERVAAAVGMLEGAPIEFERVADVPDGGVLFGLPALLLCGLLHKSREIFSMPEGFYPLENCVFGSLVLVHEQKLANSVTLASLNREVRLSDSRWSADKPFAECFSV
jgi:hypothetical protein